MRSRYSAYKLNLPKYIIDTTHKKNPDYTLDEKRWLKEIVLFTKNCSFEELKIIEFQDGNHEAFVTFKAIVICKNKDNSIIEKSRFIKELDRWLYIDGNFLENL